MWLAKFMKTGILYYIHSSLCSFWSHSPWLTVTDRVLLTNVWRWRLNWIPSLTLVMSSHACPALSSCHNAAFSLSNIECVVSGFSAKKSSSLDEISSWQTGILPAVTTEEASLSPEQSTEGVEPPGEPLPVEFQVSLHSIPLLWSLSLLFRVCPHFFLSSHFRGSWKSHLENWTKVIFPWRLEALWGAHAGALNLGGICMNDISHYEAVITKQINVGRKEMRSYYCNF